MGLAEARLVTDAQNAHLHLLLQAKALSKEATDGGSLRESAAHLPLVLMSEKGSSTDDVWRGIELGAADVLEKPLSPLKLRNIWQHVVRKVGCDSAACAACMLQGACTGACMYAAGQPCHPPRTSGLSRACMPSWCQMMSGSGSGGEAAAKEAVAVCKSESKARLLQKLGSAPSSPRTPSPAASILTLASESAAVDNKSCKGGGDEASFSGGRGRSTSPVCRGARVTATAALWKTGVCSSRGGVQWLSAKPTAAAEVLCCTADRLLQGGPSC